MAKASFFIFSLIFVAISFSLSATAALVPAIAEDFLVSKIFALKLTWLYMLPYGIFAFVWGPLTRSFTVKRLVVLSALGFCLATLFFSLAQSINQAYVFRFLMGCFGSSFVPLAFITIGKTVAKVDKAKYLGNFFAISTSSACVGVFLSGLVPWRVIYFIPAGLSLVIFILAIFRLDQFDFRGERFKLSYFETFKDKQALQLFAVIGIGSFLFHGLQQNLGVYLSEKFFLKQMTISLIFTIATLSAIAIRFFAGRLSASFGNVKITRLGYILMGVFTLVLLVSPRPELIIAAIVLWGGGWALSHTGLSAYLAHMPDKLLRDASSLNSSLRLGFGGLGAFCAGLLATSLVGFKILFIFMSVSLFLLGFFANRMLDERKENYG